MLFRKRKLRYFIAISLSCIMALILPILFPFSKYSMDHKIGSEWYVIIAIVYVVSIFVIAMSHSKICYVIEDDKIYFKGSYEDYIININEIEYIKCVFSRGNQKHYEIVLPKNLPNTISINVNLVNDTGESLITVLKNKYSVKFNNF